MRDWILLLTSMFFLYGFIALVWCIWGVLKSISDSYYKLRNGGKWVFVLAIWGGAMPIGIVVDTWCMWLGMSGIMMVGAARAMKEEVTRPIHLISAGIGITAAIADMYITNRVWWIPAAIAVISVAILIKNSNPIWWIECTALLGIHFYVYLYVLS